MTEAVPGHVVRILDDVQKIGGLRGTDIANFTAVSKATVSRWSTQKKSPHPRTQKVLADLHFVVMRLDDYYSAAEIRAWLYAMHPQLNGERAINLIHENRTEEVLGVLDRLDSDAYV